MEEQNNTQQDQNQQQQEQPQAEPVMQQEQQQQQEQPQQAAPAADAERVADPADVEKNKTMAILSYFVFFLPLLTDAKDSPFAKFHANQALILLIFSFGGYFIGSFLTIVLIGLLILPVVMVASFVFFIMGIINASNGKMKELPLIGGIHLLDK